MTKKIKWAALQPLTGGMYLGAEEAIGNPAEFILSYEGLNDPIYSKDKTRIIDGGNEYHLTQYLKKKGECPPYFKFKGCKMFDVNYSLNPEIVDENDETVDISPMFEDMDIVVAVPVCSGLSSATTAGQDAKDARNCNMKFLAEYALGMIKPKIYIFENAPALFTNGGAHVREQLVNIAQKYNYSVAFLKTDTQQHYNCQRRIRTFVVFIKDAEKGTFEFTYENKHYNVDEYFNMMNPNASQNVNLKGFEFAHIIFDFIKQELGTEWRDKLTIRNLYCYILFDEGRVERFKDFIVDYDCDEKIKKNLIHSVDHALYKLSIGKGFYFNSPVICDNSHVGAMMFKTIPYTIHPFEDRYITCREALNLMGYSDDFEMQGDYECFFTRIGQNVPVKTARYIVGQAVNFINKWDEEREHGSVLYVDNIKNKSWE